MKKLHVIVILCTFLSFSNLALAQNNTPLFTLECNTVFTQGQERDISSSLSITNTTLSWKQTNAEIVDTNIFSIDNISGAWDTNNSTGDINYQLNSEGYLAQLNVTGNSEGITATLILTISEVQQEEYLFSVQNIIYN